MNILFLVKFYQPFDRGGSEWSTHDLAKLLVQKGHKVTILTPNYGAKGKETLDGITIKRFPFLVKLKNPKAEITPFWTSNVFWFIYTILLCIWYAIKEKSDLIHVHSNEFLPAAVVAQLTTKKPTVATFRDYQTICNFGFCLWRKKKSCNFSEYLTEDFNFFYENYIQDKNVIKYAALYLAAIRSRIITRILFYFAGNIVYKVAVSDQLAQIFRANGTKNMITIHNPVIVNTYPQKPKEEVVYIGKFSKGKGVDLLIDLIPIIARKFPELKFRFIGSGVLEKSLKEKAKNQKLQDKIIFTGRVDHKVAINYAAQASLVIVPSVWPEPLPRSIIETILVGTPVVATRVGGIEEIVKNNIYGTLAKPNRKSLKDAIFRAMAKRDIYRRNITKDFKTLRDHFSAESVQKYLEIYQTT